MPEHSFLGYRHSADDLRKALDSQTKRVDLLLTRKDALYALLVRVALCRDLFAQLPADLQADIRAAVGNLIQ